MRPPQAAAEAQDVRELSVRLIALLLVLALTGSSPAYAEEKLWRWFVVTQVGDDWEFEKGSARVALSASTFRAELLWDGVNTGLRHSIAGSRQGNRLKVKLSTEGTEQVDFPLEGSYQKRSWKKVDDSVGVETIILFATGMVVGLTRGVRR